MNELSNFVLLSESKIKLTSNLRGRASSSDALILRCGSSPWRSAVVFFGAQYFMKRWLVGEVVTESLIAEAKEFLNAIGISFDEQKWRYLVVKHQGRLPVRITAASEGSVGNDLLVLIEPTDKDCKWIAQCVQNVIDLLWYPTTVATLSRSCKLILAEYMDQTSSIPGSSAVENQLFDFGYRGSTSVESAGLGGCAHLVSFKLSATIAALQTARKYYHAIMPATAIPSAEHSTITSWGREREAAAYRNLLAQFPTGKLSCVSDSYDVLNACERIWGGELHDLVCSRNGRGTVYVRPDSGDPVLIVQQVIEILASKFGSETNAKGYRVLPQFVRVIQGDGVSYGSLDRILCNLKLQGWSSENVTFGSGGSLLQKVDRSILKFDWLVCGTDSESSSGGWTDRETEELYETDVPFDWRAMVAEARVKGFSTVFENGELLRDVTFDEVRENARILPQNAPEMND